MSFDGLFLHYIVSELQAATTGRIQKIHQIGQEEFLFHIHANHKNYKLLCNLNYDHYRIHFTTKDATTSEHPNSFTMLLRKYFDGGIIDSINQYRSDRIVEISVWKNNELGDRVLNRLLIELTGKTSNLIVTTQDYAIIDCYKKTSVFEQERTLFPKAIYQFPEQAKFCIFSNTNESLISYFKELTISSYQDISKAFLGFGPLISKYLFSSHALLEELLELKHKIVVPTFFEKDGKEFFYFFPVEKVEKQTTYSTLSELLHAYFYARDIKELIRQKTNNIETVLQRAITRLKKKLEKLDQDLTIAHDYDTNRIYGELLTANFHIAKSEKLSYLNVYNYYTQEEITIQLDPKYSMKENAARYFQKYQKSKKAIEHIDQQIMESKEEILYIELILSQLATADYPDLDDILQELYENKYLKSAPKQKKKIQKHAIAPIILPSGAEIYIGKNNMQNEFLTHKFARNHDLWFHVKDAPGSHVILRAETIGEVEIRTAANYAAFYSSFQNSSSVPVDYTLIKYIKKIPGKRNCFVTYTNAKTIYIDPDSSLIST